MKTLLKKAKKNCLFCVAPFLIAALLWTPGAAAGAEGEEWVVLPVIVNIVDASDASKLDDAIKKANEIFAQAKIRLVVKKTNQNVQIGDKDGDLTSKEGDQALKDGQKEIEKTFKGKDGKWDGTGIKITLGDDCWVEEPNTIGWAVHRKPVVVVESADANSVGSTIVHELIHVLTVTDHSDDPNDVMYPTDEGGTSIDPNDIKEIFPEAKKRGTAFKIPSLPRFPTWKFPWFGISYSTHLRGAILDTIEDVQGLFPPNEPTIQYADIREVSFFAETPFMPGALGRLEIHRGDILPGFPVDSFFDVLLDIDPGYPGFDLQVHIQITHDGLLAAELNDMRTPSSPPMTLPVFVHINEKFDGSAPIPYDHSIEVHIPIELLELQLQSTHPIQCQINSFNQDFREEPPLLFADQTDFFEIQLTGCCVETRLELSDISEEAGEDMMLVKGCGFRENGLLNVLINDTPLETVSSDEMGEVIFQIRPWMPAYNIGQLSPGRHEVLVIAADDSGPSGADHTLAFFSYCPQGMPASDLNGDCVVDLIDLSLFASEWLAGTTLLN